MIVAIIAIAIKIMTRITIIMKIMAIKSLHGLQVGLLQCAAIGVRTVRRYRLQYE